MENWEIVCNSLEISEDLEKDHNEIIEKLESLDVPAGFRVMNIHKITYGDAQVKYELTKNGVLLFLTKVYEDWDLYKDHPEYKKIEKLKNRIEI